MKALAPTHPALAHGLYSRSALTGAGHRLANAVCRRAAWSINWLRLEAALCYIPSVETKREAPIIRVTGGRSEGVIDEVASELPIRIVLNNEPLVTLLCTPGELEELVVGFLFSEGL